jgi:hypothetical protein
MYAVPSKATWLSKSTGSPSSLILQHLEADAAKETKYAPDDSGHYLDRAHLQAYPEGQARKHGPGDDCEGDLRAYFSPTHDSPLWRADKLLGVALIREILIHNGIFQD